MSKSVMNIFSQIFSTYESINHILTFGLDMYWRRKAVQFAARRGNEKWLEVCTGTGETSLQLLKHADQDTLLVAADFSFPMIKEAARKSDLKKPALLLAESGALPFPDETFDLVMVTFATRNLNSTVVGLFEFFREFSRVLKPGGIFINVETSQPQYRLIRWFYHVYVLLAVKPIGRLISGSKSGYFYLSQTIRQFHSPISLANALLESGFARVRWTHLSLGVVAIHEAVK
ncbi:MAG: ubiquinone/menaquinone biosynthesis methyltransferase [Candidatus Thorarchaeota archaeon]|nr:ubiquinone/menaquinone biosynthesis methyltransferase [Candidatus Thorarchaeota archaeon]